MGLKKSKCMEIISHISSVVDDFEKYAEDANIREKTYKEIKNVINQNKLNL